jgi:hypothetical protein
MLKTIGDFNVNITKEQFDIVYNQYSPNMWIKLIFKYFSSQTEMKNIAFQKNLRIILLGIFFCGLLGTIFNLPENFIKIITYLFSASIFFIVLCLFSAIIMNNLRIKKIIKKLGISINEYNSLVDKYYC